MPEQQPKIEAGDLDFTTAENKIESLQKQIERAEGVIREAESRGDLTEIERQRSEIEKFRATILKIQRDEEISNIPEIEDKAPEIHAWGTDERPVSRDSL